MLKYYPALSKLRFGLWFNSNKSKQAFYYSHHPTWTPSRNWEGGSWILLHRFTLKFRFLTKTTPPPSRWNWNFNWTQTNQNKHSTIFTTLHVWPLRTERVGLEQYPIPSRLKLAFWVNTNKPKHKFHLFNHPTCPPSRIWEFCARIPPHPLQVAIRTLIGLKQIKINIPPFEPPYLSTLSVPRGWWSNTNAPPPSWNWH